MSMSAYFFEDLQLNILYFSDVRPVTPPDDKEREKPTKFARIGERKITVANTDLLMKLFEGVERQIEKDNKAAENKSGAASKPLPGHQVKAIRGRSVYIAVVS